HIAQLGYLHNAKDNFVFSAKFNAKFNPGDEKYTQNTLVTVNDMSRTEGLMYKSLRSNNRSFSGDFYFSKQLRNNQEIVANLVGTYYSSHSKNHLQRVMSEPSADFDYLNDTDNKSWSVIGEALYNKKFGDHELATGFRFYNKELSQTYNETSRSDIWQQVYYVYAGLSGSLSKLNYSVEIGAENSRNSLTGNEKINTCFTSFNPSLSLSYNLTKKSSLKFVNRLYGSIPEVSMLTYNPVYLNYKYLSIGNPDLKPYYILQGELKYQLSGSNIYLNTGINYNYSFKPFVAMFAEYDDLIYKTWAYKDYRYYAGYSLSMRWMPWKWVALQTYFALGYTEIRNLDGRTINDFTQLASFSLSFMYKKFKLINQMQTVFSNLYGDYLEKTGAAFTSELSYTHNSFSLGVQYIKNPNPMRLISKSEVMKLNEETVWGDYRNLVMLKAVYRFSLGKKNTIRVDQRIKNSDDDSGLREDAKAK
ncbi:MAG: outer membrane beta-barrel protein, partial [Bacteroidales bacterium]